MINETNCCASLGVMTSFAIKKKIYPNSMHLQNFPFRLSIKKGNVSQQIRGIPDLETESPTPSTTPLTCSGRYTMEPNIHLAPVSFQNTSALHGDKCVCL